MRRVVLALLVFAPGCPKPEAPTTAPAPQIQPAEPAAVAECSSADPFMTLRWVPPSAEAVTLVDLHAPGLVEALAQLAEGTRDSQRQLPIRIAFALGQWTWQVPLLRTTLERAGFAPAQLVHVALPEGASAWAWPPSCDTQTITKNLERSWDMSLRATPYGAVATAPRDEEGEFTFAYDFLAYGASAYMLVPAGTASRVAQRLAERPSDPSAPGLGESAAGLPTAPLRLAVGNRALLAPDAEAATGDGVSTFRIDADGWSTP